MNKMTAGEMRALDAAMPADQNARIGHRIGGLEAHGLVQLEIPQAAGAVGLVTNLPLPSDPELLFDFEVVDVIVRTETSVTSSAVQLRSGTNALSDAIVSAAANAITRAGTLDKTYAKFYPKSNPSGYAAAKLNLLDSGGATAAARTVTVLARRI